MSQNENPEMTIHVDMPLKKEVRNLPNPSRKTPLKMPLAPNQAPQRSK